ncbi:MAG: class I SAM-dependent methyltransferase [Patescibacteria group bacterium]|nr:class I SAM-dependent methyltransferase [Patescibacteria group bacterium]
MIIPKIKRFIKSNPRMYRFIQTLIRVIRNSVPYYLRRYKKDAFHGDKVWQDLVSELSKTFDFTSFVETGTFRGTTTLFLSKVFPKIPVFTIEIREDLLKESKWRLRKSFNVKIIKGSSSDIIPQIVKENKLGNFPFFFLDAHSGPMIPINNELKAVNQLQKAIIMIDDFEVFGNPQFKFNSYTMEDGSKINLGIDFIKENVHLDKHRILVPNYSLAEAGNIPPNKFRGHIIICQNLSEEEWSKILRLETVRHYYKI